MSMERQQDFEYSNIDTRHKLDPCKNIACAHVLIMQLELHNIPDAKKKLRATLIAISRVYQLSSEAIEPRQSAYSHWSFDYFY